MKTTFLNSNLSLAQLGSNSSERSGQHPSLSTKWRDAWARAMEQQQGDAWLQHGLLKRDVLSTVQNTSTQISSTQTLTRPSAFAANMFGSESRNKVESKELDASRGGIVNADRRMPAETSSGVDSVSSMQAVPADDNDKPSQLDNEIEFAERSVTGLSFSESTRVGLDVKLGETGNSVEKKESSLDFSLKGNTALETTSGTPELEASAMPVSTVTQPYFQSQGVSLNTALKEQLESFYANRLSTKIMSSGNENLRALETSGQSHLDDLLSTENESFDLEQTDHSSSAGQKKIEIDERNSLRFHAEMSDLGVRIWLGIDHSEKANLPSLVSHLLDWLNSQQLPLASLICNGKGLSVKRSEKFEEVIASESQVASTRQSTIESGAGWSSLIQSSMLTSGQSDFISYVRN